MSYEIFKNMAHGQLNIRRTCSDSSCCNY